MHSPTGTTKRARRNEGWKSCRKRKSLAEIGGCLSARSRRKGNEWMRKRKRRKMERRRMSWASRSCP